MTMRVKLPQEFKGNFWLQQYILFALLALLVLIRYIVLASTQPDEGSD